MFKTQILESLKNLGFDFSEKDLETPKEEFGDLCVKCFRIAKKLGKTPEELAKEIEGKMEKLWFLEKVKAVGGYVNFHFDWKEVAKKILRSLKELEKSIKNPYQGKRIMVEHTSVNPNKALHIGHARNACLGDCLVRLLNFVGNDVIVANYVDDTGSQMADIVLGFKVLGIPMETSGKFT